MSALKNVVIIMAMHEEAQLLIEALDFKETTSPIDQQLGVHYLVSEINGCRLHLILNGSCKKHKVEKVGTTPAAMATYVAIKAFHPDVIINAGTCGSYQSAGASIGDIFLSKDTIYYHDRRISASDAYNAYAIGAYPCVDTSKMSADLNLKQANMSSGNSIDLLSSDTERMKQVGSIIKDMEVAAIAEVAELYQVPMFAIKSVTNLVDVQSDSVKAFQENLTTAVIQLTEHLQRVINYLLK